MAGVVAIATSAAVAGRGTVVAAPMSPCTGRSHRSRCSERMTNTPSLVLRRRSRRRRHESSCCGMYRPRLAVETLWHCTGRSQRSRCKASTTPTPRPALHRRSRRRWQQSSCSSKANRLAAEEVVTAWLVTMWNHTGRSRRSRCSAGRSNTQHPVHRRHNRRRWRAHRYSRKRPHLPAACRMMRLNSRGSEVVQGYEAVCRP